MTLERAEVIDGAHEAVRIGPTRGASSYPDIGKVRNVMNLLGQGFPFNWPGQEMVITGPEGIHVDAITDLIETQILDTQLSRFMLAGGRSQIKHRPFHINFANGARIMGRIPQRDGRGVKGGVQ